MYKPKTSLELSIYNIERELKNLKAGRKTLKECGLNRRFERLKRDSPIWYEELYPKYITIVKQLKKDTFV